MLLNKHPRKLKKKWFMAKTCDQHHVMSFSSAADTLRSHYDELPLYFSIFDLQWPSVKESNNCPSTMLDTLLWVMTLTQINVTIGG